MSSPAETLILGAGPAGMAAAMELVKAGRSVRVVERAAQVGGLAKTLVFQEPEGVYRTDIGPHRFYSKNPYLYSFIEDLLGEEWISVPRQTRFFVDGKFYAYPIRLANVLRQIGVRRSFSMLRDFLLERGRSLVAPRAVSSFEEYVVSTFGRSLAEFNMLHYSEKIWGIPCREISVDWALQRIGGLSVWATLRKALLPGKTGPKSLVDSFYYPSRGSGRIYERIRERVEEAGSTVHLQAEPLSIRWSGSRVSNVDVREAEGTMTVPVSNVISSIPITRCIELFDPLPPAEVREAVRRLRFRSQAYLFLTVERERIMPDNWIYFPDREIPFGRISEMKNFSAAMCPPGKTSLFVEFFCTEGDDIWRASREELFERTIVVLEKLRLLRRSDVRAVHHLRLSHVYPVYDLSYDEHLRPVLEWLDSFENFFAVGRPGRFRYTNQDHSLEMGILAARNVLAGTRHTDLTGLEQEYFEDGSLPSAVSVARAVPVSV